jgi:cell surface protein SprA
MKLFLRPITFVLFTLLLAIACKKYPEVNDVKPNPASLVDMLSWNYASVPLRFPESHLNNNKAYGFNRAKISWYNIDPGIFYNKSTNLRPPNLSKDDMSADDCRVIYENELFPNKENQYNQPLNLNVFNLDYYPEERGPWNYDTQASVYSAGIGNDGKLNEPSTRWAGITRKLEITGFKTNYLDFWLIDPFTTYPDAQGELYFDIGDISEDVLKDGFLSAENTVAGTAKSSVWGLVKPLLNSNSFPSNNSPAFDTGLDELANTDETAHFASYLDEINSICSPTIFESVNKDPTNDDYHSYLGDDYNQLNYKVRDRYKNFNNGEQNSYPATYGTGVIYQYSPNTEDINGNGLLDTLNNYFEYNISLAKGSFLPGTNFIVEMFDSGIENIVHLENGSLGKTKFYHFRIPLTESSGTYGSPNLTSNPKFIRLYLKGFSTPVNLRFINLMFSEEVIVYTH